MKVNMTTLGCPKNVVDSEFLTGGLRGDNIEFVDDPLKAETIILNTCGFIQGAKEESIEAILEAVELKKRGVCQRVFVTGCLSQRYQNDLMLEIPEVDGFYGNRDMQEILRDLTQKLDLKRELVGERYLSTPQHYAYLKISEGCENPCTFCAIPGIRGKFNSRSIESLLAEAENLASSGVRELIVIAQDSTIYGADLYGDKRLVQLLDRLTELQAFRWIRLMYTYPAHFCDDLIALLADKRDVIKYVDMPVQHCSNRLLKAMARKADRKRIEYIIDQLRQNNPDIAIRTSMIVGFPGETEADQSELRSFVQELKFERLGLFTYSREEDTPAYDFQQQVPDYLKQERWSEINDIQNAVSFQLNKELIGSVQEVVADERQEHGTFIGRTVRDCPEIDNSVVIHAKKDINIGQFYRVRITDCAEYELVAEIID